jgi:hypothetical protein
MKHPETLISGNSAGTQRAYRQLLHPAIEPKGRCAIDSENFGKCDSTIESQSMPRRVEQERCLNTQRPHLVDPSEDDQSNYCSENSPAQAV